MKESDVIYSNNKTLATINLSGISPKDFVTYYQNHKTDLEHRLTVQGFIKFNGIQIETQDDFKEIINTIGEDFLDYVDGNSPRTKLSGNVYSSTEFTETQRITMHNELSYSAKWPNKLFLSCLTPAQTGGETLLADSRTILQVMDPGIVKRIEEHGIIYYRNLHSGAGMGPSWQQTFETEDKKVAEAHCKNLSMKYNWVDDHCLRLEYQTKGVIRHRSTSERIWFNQIDQFHPSHLGEELSDVMLSLYESYEKFPMYVTFGNGASIEEEMIKEIMDTIDSVTIAPEWSKNEFLILDNELFSHGRNPFTGARKVLVAMSL